MDCRSIPGAILALAGGALVHRGVTGHCHLYDSLGIDTATWIGHSYGGRLVAELAASHPDRVERAVLLDPAMHVDPAIATERAEGLLGDLSFGSPDEAIEARLGDGTLFARHDFVETSWAAKRAKMRLTGDVHCAVDDQSWKHNFDSRPEQLLEATKEADKVIVFGIKAPFCGINADQELIANFVRQHSDRFIGWCSVDPNDADCVEQLE